MSKGDLLTQGQKGYNAPWQKAVLQGLKGNNNTLTLILAALGGSPAPHTPYGPIRATGVGSIPIGAKSVSFYNAGSNSADVNGGTNNLLSGEQITFDGGSIGLATAIGYDASGTTLVIIYTL